MFLPFTEKALLKLSKVTFCAMMLMVVNFANARPYISVGVGYTRNIANLSKNSYLISQPPVPGNTQLTYYNRGKSGSSIFNIEAGYSWDIDHNWSWELGGRFIHSKFRQKGYSSYSGDEQRQSYTYHFVDTELQVVARFIYSFKFWALYADLHAGGAFIKSDDYSNFSLRDKFRGKNVINLSYGVGLGIKRWLTHHISLGVSLDYTDAGQTDLGKRVLSSQSQQVGKFKQHLRFVSILLNFSYVF